VNSLLGLENKIHDSLPQPGDFLDPNPATIVQLYNCTIVQANQDLFINTLPFTACCHYWNVLTFSKNKHIFHGQQHAFNTGIGRFYF